MMKKLGIISAAFALFMVGCADDDLQPIVTFDQAGKGAYVRLVELKSGEYDLDNISSSAYSYTAEMVDLEQGELVSSYDLYVEFADNTPDNGDSSKDEVLYTSFGQGDFVTNERGYRQIDVDLPLTDVASALGLATSEEDLAPGDFFNFRTEIILEDGSVFNFANSAAPINGSAFQGHFNFSSKVTCPLPDELFTGTYRIEYIEYEVGGFGAAFGGTPGDVEIRTIAGSSTLREFDFCYLPDDFNFCGQTLRFDIVCDEVQPGSVDTGVGCGGGNITIGVESNTPVDIANDATIEMNLIDYAMDGGCGVSSIPMRIRLVKQ